MNEKLQARVERAKLELIEFVWSNRRSILINVDLFHYKIDELVGVCIIIGRDSINKKGDATRLRGEIKQILLNTVGPTKSVDVKFLQNEIKRIELRNFELIKQRSQARRTA